MFQKFFHYANYVNPFQHYHVQHPATFMLWSGVALVGGVMVMLTIRAFQKGSDSNG